MIQTRNDSIKQELEAFFDGMPLRPYLNKYLEQYTKYGDVFLEKTDSGNEHVLDSMAIYHSTLEEHKMEQRAMHPNFDPDKLSQKEKKILNRILESEFTDI